MNNLQDHFYKKKEADEFFDRWVKNNNNEYYSTLDKKIRKEKLNILNCLKSNISLKKKNILEIGCFVGDLLFYLKKRFNCKVNGVDASKKACNLSKKIFDLKIENKIFIESKYFIINKENFQKFDLIICDDVLSWMDRKSIIQTLSAIDYLLKDGGYIFMKDYDVKKNFCFKNHHHPEKKIFSFKQKEGHKSFYIWTGNYKLIYEKLFITNKYQKVKIKDNQANTWSYSIIQKQKTFTHPIKKFTDKI
jgi:cyclopropane fatty-acyl-phospholipid synthase-like methyltransferase